MIDNEARAKLHEATTEHHVWKNSDGEFSCGNCSWATYLVAMKPATYVSRPVEVEAVQFLGKHTPAIDNFTEGKAKRAHMHGEPVYDIETLEGVMRCSNTDWIIKGTEGEFYPCKDSVFQRKYVRR